MMTSHRGLIARNVMVGQTQLFLHITGYGVIAKSRKNQFERLFDIKNASKICFRKDVLSPAVA